MEELSSVHADSTRSVLGVQRSDFMRTKTFRVTNASYGTKRKHTTMLLKVCDYFNVKKVENIEMYRVESIFVPLKSSHKFLYYV